MVKKVVSFSILCFIALGIDCFGQEQQDNEEEVTIEELYLSKNIELQIARNQAMSDSREMKMLALQNIRSIVETGKMTEEDRVPITVILDSLAKEGVGKKMIEGRTVINDFTEVRRIACNLLGKIGGKRARQSLIYVLGHDHEPMVKAEAVYALGKIGKQERDKVIREVVWVLDKENSKQEPDNNFAFATLLALEKLTKGKTTLENQQLVNTLLEILDSNHTNYINDVQLKAMDVLTSLQEG